MKKINKICISRLDKMGDMIYTLPVIQAIKIKNPNVKIYVLSSHINVKILEGLKYIDEILTINTNSKINVLIKKLLVLRKLKFDYYLNLSPTSLSYLFCFFSKAKNKATLILLSRYKKTFFSKLFIRIFSNIFCRYVHTVDRYSKLKKKEDIHQTKMIFELIKICRIPYDINTLIDIALPKDKLNLTPINKKLIIIHLTERWINRYYTEKNFLELIFKLPIKKYTYVLTTDNSTKNKFKKIFDLYKIINNKDFIFLKKLKDNITILDKLNYKNWLHIIYSSSQVITPECGILHISAACKIPVTIIYDADYFPDAMYIEYHPWKSKHTKLLSNDAKLNEKILSNLT